MNYTTLATTEDDFKKIIDLMEHGFTDKKGIVHRPNHKMAFALKLEKVSGCRIGDVVKIRPCDILKDGTMYRMNLTEEKTGKKRLFSISPATYSAIFDYVSDHNIQPDKSIIGTTERAVQKHLKLVCDTLGLASTSTHSIRKMSGCEIYELTGHDIQAVREFYQHSDTKTTVRYLTHSSDVLKDALLKLSI